MQKRAPQIPIIVLTGMEDEQLTEQIIQCGAQDYLNKSRITEDILIQSLRFAKDRHIYLQKNC